MDSIVGLLTDWIAREPTASLLLAVATALLFGVEFARSQDVGGRAGAWGRSLMGSAARALVFAALLAGVYFLLNSGFGAFGRVYGAFTSQGSLSNQAWQRWEKLYGPSFTQQDLVVAQYVQSQETPQPGETPAAGEPIAQNSILAFRGRVTMNMADRLHQPDTFNAYAFSGLYEYDIVNPTDAPTRLEFRFPLSVRSRLYQDLSVKMDGVEVPGWLTNGDGLVWSSRLAPGAKTTVSIHYVTSGMDNIVFEVSTPREVTNFKYTVALDTDNCCLLTDPENGGIKLTTIEQPPYKFITWTIDRAILAPRLGVSVRQYWPYAPYQEMMMSLPYAGRAALLFLAMLALTLLICGVPVSLRQVALLAGLFSLPALVLMAGGVPALPAVTPAGFAVYQVRMLPVLAVLPVALAFLILRGLPRLPLVLALLLMAFFMGGYPFIGLYPDEQNRNVFDQIVQVGMIVYIFGLALFVRVRGVRRPPA